MKQTPDYGTRILAVMAAAFLLLAQFIWLMPSESFAETAGDELVVRVQYYGEIGDKIREKARFSRSELESMGSQTWYYTNITRVGTVMSMAAYGPEVLTIIDAAGIDIGSIGNITFRTTDGYTRNFTVDKHLRADKYYYPNLPSCYERNEEGNALTPTAGALEGPGSRLYWRLSSERPKLPEYMPKTLRCPETRPTGSAWGREILQKAR